MTSTTKKPRPAPPEVPKALLKYREKALRSLFFFARHVLGYDKLTERIHGPICAMLQDLNRHCVNITMPRKFYKTTLASVAYPLWRAVNDPNVTFLLAMNTMDNACEKLRDIRRQVELNAVFRGLFPEVIPDFKKDWREESATLRRDAISGTPTFRAAGRTTHVVSRAIDEIVMDDILTAQESEGDSGVILPGANDVKDSIWWYRGAISLLKDPEKSRLINVGTRWAEQDLVAHVLKTNRALAENNIELRAVDGLQIATDEDGFLVISGGTATMPEHYPISALQTILQQEGETLFRLWYQNEPIDPSELVFQLDAQKNYYKPNAMPADWLGSLRKYTGVDLAFSTKAKADNTAIVTVGVDRENVRYVLDVQYGKFNPNDTIDRLFAVYGRFQPRVIGIESVSAQSLMPKLMPHFMRERDMALPVREIPRKSTVSQAERIMWLQPWMQQGLIRLPVGMVASLEAEMRDFRLDTKRSGHDDALSALSDAVRMSREPSALPEKPQKHVTTAEEWEKFYREKFFNVDYIIEQGMAGEAKSKRGYFCNETEFAYLGARN